MISRGTTLALFALVAGLAGAAWWQTRRESVRSAEQDVALFEDFTFERVTAVRVDNSVRDGHFRAERDGDGRWRLTDPVEVPANGPMLDFLVRSAIARRGAPVAEAEADPQKLGLEPPRVVLEIEERAPSGARRERLEIGALDLDGKHVYVRSRGRLLRTIRDIDTTLDRSVEDFKATTALDLDVRRIVEVHRAGKLARQPGEDPVDLRFDALSEDGGWRATAPMNARLDPVTMHLWIQGVARVPIARYVEDGAAALSDYGLDPPEMTITLASVDGTSHELAFGRPGHLPGNAWFQRVGGQRYWCAVDAEVVQVLASDAEEFFDHLLCRLPVPAIDGLVLRSKQRELLLARSGNAWTVAERAHDGATSAAPMPADAARVTDLIGKLAKVEIVRFADGTDFDPLGAGEMLSIQAGEARETGAFGTLRSADGPAPLAAYRREGDTAIALLDPIVLEWLDTPIESLLSTRVVAILEAEQASLSILGGEKERSYEHTSKGLWVVPGVGTEARDLSPELLEALLFVRAAKHLPRDTAAPLREPITVEFTDKGGGVQSYAIGIGDGPPDESIEVEVDGRRAVVKDQRVHQRLKELLGL